MESSEDTRREKIARLKELQQGKISLEEFTKIATGKRVVLSTFLDHLQFFNCKEENGEWVDRQAQIDAGEIEVVFADSPFNRFLEGLPGE